MTEITHPTHGTLDETLAAIKAHVARGEMPYDLQRSLSWFVHQYGLVARAATRSAPYATDPAYLRDAEGRN